WPPPKVEVSAAAPPPSTEEPLPAAEVPEESLVKKWLGKGSILAVTLAAIVGIGGYAPESFLTHFTVFVLACFIGWQVVWNVTASLHTPLMSVTNAISGIIVIGAILHLVQAGNAGVGIMSFAAVLIATINVAGGFRVTHRMLKMFRK
ncbi:MAG TPA: NAD(P)(+) transhydrogenase (Re/Si-specific) subunit alpha, partial [Porticoccus sp.]|nr:NAD(P)(+) transhydrogenase (Re/Si-specific) subunit alpha [Porticoccus sp.]